MKSKLTVMIILWVSVVSLDNRASSDDLLSGQVIDMGESDGVSYRAVPTSKPEHTTMNFDIQRESNADYETISRIEMPVVCNYYAGIQSTGDYFYLAGENPSDSLEAGVPGTPDAFLYVYSLVSLESPLVEFSSDEYDPWGREFAFGEDNTLYMVIKDWSFDILYKIDIKAGEVTMIAEKINVISVHPDEGYCLILERSSYDKNWYEERFADVEHGFLVPPNTSCICHPNNGYCKYLYIDLSSGAIKNVSKASATSILVEEGKPTDHLGPGKAIDDDISTAWVEGVSDSGNGETLTVDFAVPMSVYSAGILPGFANSPQIYFGNNRLKKG